jgi:four helix bundle protein
MEFKTYKDLEVWKESRLLVKMIYQATQQFPDAEKFGLTNQMRRCAVSVVSNIAEGVGRNYSKETVQFLHIAKGSTYELETQIIVANDLAFLNEMQTEELLAKLDLVKKLLHGFIQYKQKN